MTTADPIFVFSSHSLIHHSLTTHLSYSFFQPRDFIVFSFSRLSSAPEGFKLTTLKHAFVGISNNFQSRTLGLKMSYLTHKK
jgi:hypothetical protein